jgi:hypothetical protein
VKRPMVSEWIDDWKRYFVNVIPRADWPEPRSDYWGQYFRHLCDRNAAQDVARKAVDRLSLDHPSFLDGMFKAFTAAFAVEEKATASGGGIDVAEAKRLSCECALCGGDGVTMFARSDGKPFSFSTPSGLKREAVMLPMACPGCPLGQAIAADKQIPNAADYGDRVMPAWRAMLDDGSLAMVDAGPTLDPDNRRAWFKAMTKPPERPSRAKDPQAELDRLREHRKREVTAELIGSVIHGRG